MRFVKFSSLLFFISLNFSAQQKDSSSKYLLTLNTSNDSWGGGFTQIKDDYRSFGLNLGFQTSGCFTINCNGSALTDKGKKLFSDSSRLDEFSITSRFMIKKEFLKLINIHGVLGFYQIGKFGGGAVQNQTHKVFGVSAVKLPYNDYNKTFFQIGTTISSKPLVLKKFSSAELILQPELESYWIPDYLLSTTALIPFKLYSPKGICFSISSCYRFANAESKNTLLNKITQIESGPIINYTIRMGIFSMGWNMFLNSNFSSGYYGLNIPFYRKKTLYSKQDINAEFGALNNSNGLYSKYNLNIPSVFQNHLSFILYHQFGTYLKKRLIDYPKVYGHFLQVCIGTELNMSSVNKRYFISPYAAVYLGIKRESVYSGTEQVLESNLTSPAFFWEGGIKLNMPGYLFYENMRWGISLHYKYFYPFSAFESNSTFRSYNLPTQSGYFGAGIFVNADL